MSIWIFSVWNEYDGDGGAGCGGGRRRQWQWRKQLVRLLLLCSNVHFFVDSSIRFWTTYQSQNPLATFSSVVYAWTFAFRLCERVYDDNVPLFRCFFCEHLVLPCANIDLLSFSLSLPFLFISTSIYNYSLLLIDKYLQICIHFTFDTPTDMFIYVWASIKLTMEKKEKIKQMIIIAIMVKWETKNGCSQSYEKKEENVREEKYDNDNENGQVNWTEGKIFLLLISVKFDLHHFISFPSHRHHHRSSIRIFRSVSVWGCDIFKSKFIHVYCVKWTVQESDVCTVLHANWNSGDNIFFHLCAYFAPFVCCCCFFFSCKQIQLWNGNKFIIV